jgi:hypothetical protein
MFVPGSNLLLVGGLFLAGWFSGRLAWNRNEAEYQAQLKTAGGTARGDRELQEVAPAASAPEESKKEA